MMDRTDQTIGRRRHRPWAAAWTVLVCAAVSIACLAVPIYVIRPFRPQEAHQLAFALTVRSIGPRLSGTCALVALLMLLSIWKRAIGLLWRLTLITLSVIVLADAVLTHVNIFEIMFHPYPSPAFGDANSAQVDTGDKVLAVRIGKMSHAYPIRIMGYHHIVNDTVGGVPIAATYCTLCHAGLVWSRLLDGRTLTFRLAGINNGNALMRDEQTNSIWQQNTGLAIFGALKGRQLTLVHSDELTFALWRAEQQEGLVLKPDSPYASEYESRDWEKHVEATPTVIDTRRSGISPHELMLGVTISGVSKAYPVKSILAAKEIQDRIGGDSIVILVGPDSASIRVFQAKSAANMTFIPAQNAGLAGMDGTMQDAESGSLWNFKGCAFQGKLAGECLESVDSTRDYWFDWMNHHPATVVFR